MKVAVYYEGGGPEVLKYEEAADAHAYIESRQAFGRVVLVPDGVSE